MKKSVLLLLLTFMAISVFGQQKFTISGTVTDVYNGETMIDASIYVPKLHKGTTSNTYGFYSLSLPPGTYEVVYSFVGYEPYTVEVVLDKDQRFDVLLKGLELMEVELVEKVTTQIQEKTQMSTIDLPMEAVEKLPVFMGERDILKTAQLLPGIQSGNEGTSGLFVRGGSPDQNLILLDGVPVYNANHLFGFFSVFNPDAISSVSIMKGGFPARYGGRLSSVIDVRMKEGNMREFEGEFSAGIIATKIAVQGPIKKDTTSYIISARRTYIDALIQPFLYSIEGVNAGYFFHDVNAKINHKINREHRIYASAYFGKDKAYNRESYGDGELYRAGLEWGNLTSALRWNWQVSDRLFSNVTLTYSNYEMAVGFEEIWEDEGERYQYEYEYSSGIRDWALKYDLDFIPNPNHYFRVGGNYIYHTFNPGVNLFKADENGQGQTVETGGDKIYSGEYYLYAEDDWVLTSRLKANVGIHYSGFSTQGKNYQSVQPRISARYLITDDLSFKASYVQMAQYIHLLSNSGIGLPTDLWLPSTQRIEPQLSQQFAVGFAYSFSKEFEISLEGYYKDMRNVIEYKDGASFGGGEDWEDQIEVGDGWAYGAEIFLQRKFGKFTGWLGYTLSWSWRQFDNLNGGDPFPYRFDRRHDISFAGTYEFNELRDIGVVWVYGTGNAVSLPIATFQAPNQPLDNNPYGYWGELNFYDERNGYRMPAYHRLDISYNTRRYYDNGALRTWSFGVYNLYNRQNPFYLYFQDRDFDDTNELYQISLFPLMPYVSYNLKF